MKNYIYPPRAETAIPRGEIEGLEDWIGQPKYNGTRCEIIYNNDPQNPGTIELWNRHGEKIRNYNPPEEIIAQLRQLQTIYGLTDRSIIDAELLDAKHAAIKDTIAIFDILVHNGAHLLDTTYLHRYNILHEKVHTNPDWMYTHPKHDPQPFGITVTPNIFLPHNYRNTGDRNTGDLNTGDLNTGNHTFASLWEMVDIVNAPYTIKGEIKPVLEGIMYKNPEGLLKPGWTVKNNAGWQIRSRVTTKRHTF